MADTAIRVPVRLGLFAGALLAVFALGYLVGTLV